MPTLISDDLTAGEVFDMGGATYTVADTVVVPTGCTLQNGTIAIAGASLATGSALLAIGDGSATWRRTIIRNVTVSAPLATQEDLVGIRILGATYCTVEDCDIQMNRDKAVGAIGVELQSTDTRKVNFCTVSRVWIHGTDIAVKAWHNGSDGSQNQVNRIQDVWCEWWAQSCVYLDNVQDSTVEFFAGRKYSNGESGVVSNASFSPRVVDITDCVANWVTFRADTGAGAVTEYRMGRLRGDNYANRVSWQTSQSYYPIDSTGYIDLDESSYVSRNFLEEMTDPLNGQRQQDIAWTPSMVVLATGSGSSGYTTGPVFVAPCRCIVTRVIFHTDEDLGATSLYAYLARDGFPTAGTYITKTLTGSAPKLSGVDSGFSKPAGGSSPLSSTSPAYLKAGDRLWLTGWRATGLSAPTLRATVFVTLLGGDVSRTDGQFSPAETVSAVAASVTAVRAAVTTARMLIKGPIVNDATPATLGDIARALDALKEG